MTEQLKAPREARALAQWAYALFEEFRAAYAGEWNRLEKAERMYRGDHWWDVPVRDPNEPRPVTPVLQSTVENVSADLLDMLPEAVITAESAEDTLLARTVEAIVRQNHDAACYEREYQKLTHDLLVGGYMVQEVGYDPLLNRGLGGAFIRHVDNRSILFDPLVTDVQDSRAVFKIAMRTRAWLYERYPQCAPEIRAGGDMYRAEDAVRDGTLQADRSDAVLVLECWWRAFDARANRFSVHMARLAAGQVLEDSRAVKPEGYYAHGEYPFVVTPLFMRKGSCLGYGFVDMFEMQQRFSDKLDQIVLKNALMASRNKLLVTHASGFDAEDLRDWAKDVHQGESLGGLTWFSTPPLPAYIISYIQAMRESIKEESGANDFSRGNTTGGITAASAIAALQEMSAKRARMAARQMHNAFKDAVRMEIEVEREFCLFTREVNVTVDGEARRVRFSSALLEREGKRGGKRPVEFYISIKVQKANRWSVMSQNELVLEMTKLGVITPEQAAGLMLYDGKDEIMKQVREAKRARGEAPAAGLFRRKKERSFEDVQQQ